MAPLAPFGAAREVVVAVSGGADSMALAVLLAGWGHPVAAIVDHGLRPGSAAEAAEASARLAAIGVPSRVLAAGLSPGPAQAERARAARYRLLLAFCAEIGRPDLFLAHHAGDQAETTRMREQRGSGLAGLAGMAAVDHWAEARLLRPLLTVDPARLRATLRAVGVHWVEDPGNADIRTGRGRLRATMDAVDRAAAMALGRRAALARATPDPALAAVEIRPEGYALLPHAVDQRTLSALIWTISGRTYPPPTAAVAAGLATRTVHGVLIRPAGRLGPGTLVAREPAAVAPAVPAADGALWDGRFRLRGAPPPGLSFGAVGPAAPRLRRWSPLPSHVLAGLPALWRGDDLVVVPHLHFPDAATCRSVRVSFSSRRPVAPMLFIGAVNPSESRGV